VDADRDNEVHGRFMLSHAHARYALDGLDRWVLVKLGEMDPDVVHRLVVATAKFFVQTADEIYRITVESNLSNPSSDDDLPAVLPHQLVKTDQYAFNTLLTKHQPRLSERHSEIEIHQIAKDFVEMGRAYRQESIFGQSIRLHTDQSTSFEEGWSVAVDRFPSLRQFCGDLASAFPNTSTVESDFSILGWEKDVHRGSLTDFSLEGILHCKQFKRLKEVEARYLARKDSN
jgi:hypothetical protein